MSTMDWGSVISTAVTGVVGLAGIGGTFLSARMAGRSQDLRERLAEKRRAYSGVLAAWATYADAENRVHAAGTAKRESLSIERDHVLQSARVATYEVVLIGNLDIGQMALHVEESARAAGEGGSGKDMEQAYANMLMAMRADLGYND
jgi:hypothetical protein